MAEKLGTAHVEIVAVLDTLDRSLDDARGRVEQAVRRMSESNTHLQSSFDSVFELVDVQGAGALDEHSRRLAEVIRLRSEGLGLDSQARDLQVRLDQELLEGNRQAALSFADLREVGLDALDAVNSGFVDAVIRGRDFGGVVLELARDFEKLVVQATLVRPLESALSRSSGGDGIFGSIFGGLKNLFGFAAGGSFLVPGAGGIDSQLVAFRATPGERVKVTPASELDRSVGGGVISLTIVNQTSAAIGAARMSERSPLTGSRDIVVQLEEKLASRIRQGGPMARAIQERIGAGVKPIAR